MRESDQSGKDGAVKCAYGAYFFIDMEKRYLYLSRRKIDFCLEFSISLCYNAYIPKETNIIEVFIWRDVGVLIYHKIEDLPMKEKIIHAREYRETLLRDPYRPMYHFTVPDDFGYPADP